MAQENAKNLLLANNDFTKELYAVLSKKSDDNILCSPLSVHAILSMAHCGAAGTTKEAFVDTLHIIDHIAAADGHKQLLKYIQDLKNVKLLVGNRMFIAEKHSLNPGFQIIVTKNFGSSIQSVDFGKGVEATDSINSWVKEKTEHEFPKLFETGDIPSNTDLVLVNTVHFRGNWFRKFEKDRTTMQKFFVSENEEIDCQMMHTTNKFRYKDDESLKAKVLMIPYVNEEISMIVILPSKKGEIDELEERLASADLNKIANDMYETELSVSLPKFRVEQTIDLKEALEELGLEEIFTDSCNLSGMLSKSETLTVNKVIQKTFFEVNEEGVEATTATGMVSIETAILDPTNTYHADHPFIFFLGNFEENTSKIICCGKIVKPVSRDSYRVPTSEGPSPSKRMRGTGFGKGDN